ncbi:hypothetical protein HPB52_006949 [Rhipicephalus sanguineus]|uniref:Uncharacterized protein n=1 Tax=Rhipicephalus sanguineus TaxID=34632 RepID=A0A9D4SS83_RHISA|nr:hypothetical protein HPB52_006949 [Rhipicephalus sanguineus]
MVQTQMASTYPQYVTQNGGERADGKDGSFALPIVTTNGVEQQTVSCCCCCCCCCCFQSPRADLDIMMRFGTLLDESGARESWSSRRGAPVYIVKQKLSADAGAAARMRIAYLEQQGTLEARDITGTAVDKVRIQTTHTTHEQRPSGEVN